MGHAGVEGGAAVCYSADASFTSGVAIGALGLATLPLVSDRRQLLFAGLPVLFCVHQLLEGVIWQQIDAAGGAAVRTPAVEAWLLISWLVLPVLIPLAVRMFEPDERRRRWMLGLAGLGLATGGLLAVESIREATAAIASGHHLDYAVAIAPAWVLGVPYVAATCLPLLVSSHRFVVRFGGALLISLVITLVVDAQAFTSVWCFFAALLSVALFVHYARERFRRPDPIGAPA
jgi:hypothetical protein